MVPGFLPGGGTARVEREEIRSVPVAGKLAALATPQVLYEVNYRDARGRLREVMIRASDGAVFQDDDDDDWDDKEDDPDEEDERPHRRRERDGDNDRPRERERDGDRPRRRFKVFVKEY